MLMNKINISILTRVSELIEQPEMYVFIFQVLPNRETFPKVGFSIVLGGDFYKNKKAPLALF